MSRNRGINGNALSTLATPTVGYLGWHGRGNIGDDAIYDVVRQQLSGARFVDLPVLPGERIRAALSGAHRSFRRSAQVVGGGTLVGTRYFRPLVDRGLRLTRGQGSYAIGAGVDDPAFPRRHNASEAGELARWVPLLSRFEVVSVRGPRSAELLADVGLEVSVSGDPALLLPGPQVAVQDGLIGLNLGFGDDDLWGHDPAGVAVEVAGAVEQLGRRGFRFVGILMNRDDQRWTEQALARVGEVVPIVRPGDAAAAAAEFARCSVVIVSRLHAGILAALSATPVVSLEYQPKCRDFALSIDDERSLIRTDEVSGPVLVERVVERLAEAGVIRARTAAAVGGLQNRLHSEYRLLADHLGLGRS